jgi:hypothetical protein
MFVRQLEPLTAKGMVQSGPETVTETVTNPGMIDGEFSREKFDIKGFLFFSSSCFVL